MHCSTYEKQFIALKGCATSWKIDLFWKKVIQCLELSLKVLALFPCEFSLNIIMNLIEDKDDNVDHANAAGDARG